MNLVVAGVESSGTKLVTGLLRACGATVTHQSVPSGAPHDRGWRLPDPLRYDAAVVVVRHSPWQRLSAVDNGHATDYPTAARVGTRALSAILTVLALAALPVHIATYEALVYERDVALGALCADLGLDVTASVLRQACEEVGNANAKWWGGQVFRDARPEDRRGVRGEPSPLRR